MKLIIIYGPPASGKLTIATKLARRIGFKVFDNHFIIDNISPLVLDKSSPFEEKVKKPFFDMYREVKLSVIDCACKIADIPGMIITEAYTGKQRFFTSMIKTAEKNKCPVYLVKLDCKLEELKKRVYGKSRLKYTKFHDEKGLLSWLNNHKKRDLTYPYKKSLILDNTRLSVNQSVDKILKFVGR